MNSNSLRTHSLMLVLAVVIPVLIVYAFLSHAHVSYQLGRRLDGRMSHELKMLKEAVLRSAGDNNRLREIVDLMPIDSFPQRRLYGIWEDDQLVLATENLPFGAVPDASSGYSTVSAAGSEWRVLAEFLPASAATHQQRIAVIVADPMSARVALIRGGAIDTMLPVLIAVPVLIIGIYFALGRSLRPLTRLADQIRDRSADRLHPIETAPVPGEALPIAESVNALMSRLAKSIERERKFTADAAHELRTPLTALKAHAQIALSTEDETLRRDTLHSISRTVSRTDHLISQLLILARLDPQTSRLQSETVDLGKVASQSLFDLNRLAEDCSQRLQLTVEPECIVRGSATALAVLARNLVENAIKYSNDGATVNVRVFHDAKHTVFEVSDTGPGIPDESKQEVFDRFRRLSNARASGTGLGLSIVQRIAELHEAQVSLHDVETGRGLRVTVRIPP